MLIRETDRKRLFDIFDTLDMPFEVWAYGSRVNRTAHEGSDLDLVIRGDGLRPIPAKKLSRLLDKIRDSNIPILVELRDWAVLPDSFRKNIQAKHEVFYNREHKTRINPSAA